MSSKRKLATTVVPVTEEGDLMRITPLGAGQEVGRSCILVEYKGKTLLLDCGLHPAHTGIAALPFFDEIDPASIDLLLVTQCALCFKGLVCCKLTHW
jgi:cleavage and polyadenylation specificity factor subunit 3